MNVLTRATVNACAGLSMLCAAALPAHAATAIELWHSLDGAAAEELGRIARSFNDSQSDYVLTPIYKGSEQQAYDAGITAQRSGHAPHMLQVDDSLNATAAAASKSFMPVYQMLARAKQTVHTSSFLPLVSDGATDSRGRLISFPFAASTPLLFYNRDAFKAAGLAPDAPLHTWLNVQAAALKIVDSGAAPCAFTTEEPSWVHVENLFSWHNEPFASVRNGPHGKEVRLAFNSRLMILHVGLLSSWVRSGLFSYFGRGKAASQKFASGECAMLTGSSGSIMDIRSKAKFDVGVAPMPVHEDFAKGGTSAMPRSANLWVMSGKKPAEYAGVAKFFAYLSRPDVQAQWHQTTGYLPTVQAAVDLSRKQGFYEREPEASVSVNELHGSALVAGTRSTSVNAVRGIVDDELESVWSRSKTPMEGVTAALDRSNKALKTLSAAGQLK